MSASDYPEDQLTSEQGSEQASPAEPVNVLPTAGTSAADVPTELPEESHAAMTNTEEAVMAATTEDAFMVSHEADVMAGGDDEGIGASEDHHEDADYEADHSEHAAPSGLKRGQIVEGRIVKTSPTEVMVEVGEGVIGIINSRELERLTSVTLETLQVDNTTLVYVLSPMGQGGQPVLSISRALEEKDWREAEQYYKDKKVYFGKVAGYNKGGLVVRFGRLRGFVPASQISQERRVQAGGENPEERWGDMIGDGITIKVVEINRARNRLILSEQAAQREVRELRKSNLINELQVGERRTGRVISLSDFGAFVDIGGADGLVHLTEITWQHITHPREVLSIGQEVEVEVINVDRENKRIGLSMRRLESDPWDIVTGKYRVGQLIQATITKLTKFGAFARLVELPEVEGLIHISELAEHRVNHPREVVNEGDVFALRILKLDRDNRRIGLSLRQVDSAEYIDLDWEIADSQQPGK